MCYKKPGPRCSRHTKQALDAALAKFVEDSTPDTYLKVIEARAAYETTPQGWRALEDKIAASADEGEVTALQERLAEGKRRRVLAKEALKSQVLVENLSEPQEGTNSLQETTEEDEIAPLTPSQERARRNRDARRHIVNGQVVDPAGTNGFYAVDANMPQPRDSGYGGYARFKGSLDLYSSDITYDYDRYCRQEQDGYECLDYPCGHQELENISYVIDHKRYYEGLLKEVAPQGTEVNLSLNDVAELEQISEAHLSTKINYGHYGAESFDLHYDQQGKAKVTNILNSYVYGSPNAVDSAHALSYAREEGVDTAGMTPLESLRSLVDSGPYVSDQLKQKVAESTDVTPWAIYPQNVLVSQNALHQAQQGNSAEERQWSISPRSIAGVVWYDKAKHEYHLVDGFERFAKLNPKGVSTASFLVLD